MYIIDAYTASADELVIDEMSWSGNDLSNVVTTCFCGASRTRGVEAWLGISAPIDDDALVA